MTTNSKEYGKKYSREYRKKHPELKEMERVYIRRMNYVNRHIQPVSTKTRGFETKLHKRGN